jgi:hypothetical protein
VMMPRAVGEDISKFLAETPFSRGKLVLDLNSRWRFRIDGVVG